MGASLWFDFTEKTTTSETLFEDRVEALARELGNRGRAKTVLKAANTLLAMMGRQRDDTGNSRKKLADVGKLRRMSECTGKSNVMVSSGELELAAEQHAHDSIVQQRNQDAVDDAADDSDSGLTQEEVVEVRAELEKMRVFALCKLAEETGVEQEKIESTMDSAEPKQVLIELILQRDNEEHALVQPLRTQQVD